jgi:hypothetical protein
MARARRRNMRSVDVWGIDVDGTQRLSKAFSHRSEPIWQLYTYHLKRGVPIKATCSWMRIAPLDGMPPGTPSGISPEEPRDNFGFGETMICPVDREILRAPQAGWPSLYLDWLVARVLEMAAVRDWDTAPILAARDRCVEAGVEAVYKEWVRISGPSFTAFLDLDMEVPDHDPHRVDRQSW